MKEDTKEYTLDDLEDIIREYSSHRLPNLEESEQPSGDTVRLGKTAQDTVRLGDTTADTVRLDSGAARKQAEQDTKPLPDLDEDVRVYQPAKKQPKKPVSPYSETWEPEYDAPMGEYPHQEPIAFPPKNRLHLLQEQLEKGPQQRYADLSQKSISRLQAGIFLHLVLFLASAATALLYYQVDSQRLRLMVIGQIVFMLLSGLVGGLRLREGVTDMLERRFRLNSLMAVSFLVCCLDGLLCLKTLQLPFGCVFSLQMLMAQWAEYQKRQTEMSQLDTLRKAVDLTAVVKTEKYYKGQPAYQTMEGHPEDFMDHYREETGPEKTLCRYALGAVALGGVLAIVTAILHGVAVGLRVYAAALLAAVPASAFISIQRPMAILEKRMHKLGTVLCGWRGLQNIEKQGFYPLHYGDLFPENHVKLNGVRFYGERNINTVVSYVAALMTADGGSLAGPFEQLRASRNARVCRVEELISYPDGIGGQIDGLSVVAGTLEFMENMGVALPEGARIPHAVYAAVNQSLCAVFAVSFTRSKSSASGLRTLCDSNHVRPILVDFDFILTGPFLEQKLGVSARRMQFPDCATRTKLAEKKPADGATAIALATRGGLAQRAYAVTGGAALRSAWRAGAAVHILGGGIGFLAVAILALQGSLFLLTPYNLLLYGCVWMVPGLLVAEWTRSI